MSEERLESVRKRLTPALREAIQAAIAAGRLPRSMIEAMSKPSLETLAADRAPLESLVPVAALEAIVQRLGRPPLLVRNDKVVLEALTDFPADTDVKIKGVEPWIPSVGRIEFLNHSMSWGGTGWVAGKRNGAAIIVTNRHVAKIVARRKADGTGVFLRSPSGARYGASVDFHEEVDSPDDNSRTARINAIDYLADDVAADIALLRVEAADFEMPTPFELIDRAVSSGDLVALIGYPAYDSRNNADDQARYFRDLYEVKRFAPGKVMQPPSEGTQLTHDCTSLGGNSGSPLISLEDGKVVGLHFSGEYGKANVAVGAATLKQLLSGERPISVILSSTAGTEAPDGHHTARDLTDRKGFNPKFLRDGAIATPWPGLPTALQAALAEPSDRPSEPNELRYTHFGVKYSARHKLPLLTAVNIDGARSVRIKRGTDKWFADGRIPSEIQLGAANFADTQIDRGHMVRREDANWTPDSSEDVARQADGDTFHYVNAAAQHSTLNQGKTLWQGLENYILDSARTHGFHACVFTGPVLRAEDDEEEEIEIDGALVPLEYWKLVATLDEAGTALHATAYLLSQGQLIRKLLEKRSRREALEGFVLGAYRTFQLSVADLAQATGYDFSAYESADPLVRTRARGEAPNSGEPIVIPLEEMSDTRL